MTRDLAGRPDVLELVSAFYRSAFADELIGPIFTDVAHLDLDRHLPIMCDFWETVLFDVRLYRRDALRVHFVVNAMHPLEPVHFDRWLALWVATVDACFAGPKAELAKLQASRIAGSMARRMSARSADGLVPLGDRRTATLSVPTARPAGGPAT